MYIEEVSDCLIDHDCKFIFVSKQAKPMKVRRFQKGISREFAEQSEKLLSTFTIFFKVVNVGR